MTTHLSALRDMLVDIIDDGVMKREFVVKDLQHLARIIQDATVKFANPRLVAQHCDEDLEARLRDVMEAIVRSLDSPDGRATRPPLR